MSPTWQQIKHVQVTFAIIAAKVDVVPELFYRRLFELDPSLRHLFEHDMAKHRRMLMQMLTFAIYSLRDTEAITPILQQFGDCQAASGILKCHYVTFRNALIWTLEQSLGNTFTLEVKEAWQSVLESLVSIATEGLYSEITDVM